jgi:hypothetical protein
MAGFLYFIPDKTREVKLADIGEIRYAFDRSLIARDVPGTGPSGGSGVIVADESFPSERLGYYPSDQTWRNVPGTPYHVGFYTEDRPVPSNLALARMLPGHDVSMADGNYWAVPSVIVRKATEDGWPGEIALPRSIGMDADGNWTRGDVLPKYAKLPEICGQWWSNLMSSVMAIANKDEPSQSVGVKFVDWFNSVATVLQANYRISGTEIAMLGILDEQCASDVMNAAVDWPVVLEYLSKKREASAA